MSGWPRVPLGVCCEIVSGATPSTSNRAFWGGDICWATPKDLSDLDGSYISETPRKLTRAGLENCAANVLPAGSVLFSSRAPIGHVAINTVPMATNQGFKSFVPDTQRVQAKYLLHWLRTNRPYLESLGNGATFKEVSKATVARVELPLPPLKAQARIAAILDRADALRAKRRAGLAHLSTLAATTFTEMFGDPGSNPKGFPVQQLSTLVRGGDTINYGVVQPGPDLHEGVPLIRVADLVDGSVAVASLKRIAPAIEGQYKRSRLRGDEILVSCVGSVGQIAMANEQIRGFNIARAVARIPLADNVSRLYIAAYLRTDFVQRYFVNELRTVSQPTLNIKQLSETPVLLPAAELQRMFEERITAIGNVATAQGASLRQFDALFASVQHRAFRGEL